MAICPTCTREAPKGAKACPHDGTQLDQASTTGTLMRATPLPPARAVTAARISAKGAAAASAEEQRHTDLDAILSGESQPITPGTRMGEYEVTHKLGEGGMGEVYAAVHPIIGKKVAIKVLSDAVAANREVVRRFVDEARAVNQIGHASIVDVFSFGQHSDGRHFYVMEHLEGCSLEDEICERGIMPADEIVSIVVQTLDALKAAHDKGIIHRDLKPDNIFLVEDSRGRAIKLLDFGIAKLSGEESRSRTQTGVALGTPDYMSPEQCRGTKIDLRTDIYAMGVMLYRMFTGHFPFEGAEHVLELFMQVANEAPTKPTAHVPVSEAFEALMLKCLEKEPADRFASVTELSEELQAALADLEEHGSPVGIEAGGLPSRLSEGETSDMTLDTDLGASAVGLDSETSEQDAVVAVSETSLGRPAAETEAFSSSTREEGSDRTQGSDGTPWFAPRFAPIAGALIVAVAGVAFFATRGAGDSNERAPGPSKVVLAVSTDAGVVAPIPPSRVAAIIDAALPEIPEAALTGGLLVKTGHRKAVVLIDDEVVGKGKSVSAASLRVGVHAVTVRTPRCQELEFEVTIAADKIVEKQVSLGCGKPVAGSREKTPAPDKKPALVTDRDKTLSWDP